MEERCKMNKNDLLTPDELNALLTTEKIKEQEEPEFVLMPVENPPDQTVNRDQALIAELQQAVRALTYRVEDLEEWIRQQIAGAECAKLMVVEEINETAEPADMSSYSRRESYGKKQKKKRSFWQRLLD
jgi:hypothetical protein